MNDELIHELARCSSDPLRYAFMAYPWGEPGTDLAKHDGPDFWQIELFDKIGRALRSGQRVVRIAVKSGHGIGKSAGSSILTDWGMSTFEGTKGVITANTERQLRTKTWVELAKWRRLSITRELFKMKATALFSQDPEQRNEWRFDMSPWSERNTEAFAGLHNQGKRLILIMDEASGIPDIVWEVAEGALTDEDTQIIWVAFGNPTRNSGRFFECFDDGRFADRWEQITVDSRISRFTNKEELAKRIEDYGLDHDYTRVRILGLFPKHDVLSFISRASVMSALSRDLEGYNHEPVVIGVDPARFGNDASVIFPRQGRDARSRPIERHEKLDTVQLAAKAAEAYSRYQATMIYVDGTGVGGGVVDQLRNLGFPVYDVQFSSSADNTNQQGVGTRYANKRAEIWGGMRDWLATGVLQNFEIDTDYTIIDDLISTHYYYTPKDEIQLEPKSVIKQREGRSPDIADALACTFAMPSLHLAGPQDAQTFISSINYNPYAGASNA
jgi:hypothetical protein